MPKADIGDAEIFYIEEGDGPPLFLVPGLGGTAAFWQRQIEAFAPHFRVIAHDHRGCGQSTHSIMDYSVDQMAADAVKLMDALGLDSVHYCGHSTGGAMGQIIAQDYPDRLNSLVLSATWAGQDAFFRRCFEVRGEVLRQMGFDWYTKASTLALVPPWWIAENDDLLTQMAKAQAEANPPNEILLSRIAAIMAFDRRDRMADIKTPTMVICADDDNVTPIYLSHELIAGIAGAEKVALPRGGHFAPTTCPDDYNAPVLEYLRRQAGV